MRGLASKVIPILIGVLFLVFLFGRMDRRGAFDPLELRLMDFRFLVRGNVQPPAPIVIVTYDEISFQEMEGWPWPRTYHAEAIRKLKAWGAKVVAFDQLFLDPSKLMPADQDRQLAAAMKEAGNVVVAGKFDYVQQLLPDPQDPSKFKQINSTQYLEPLPMFREAATVGYLNMIKDTDGYVRRIPLLQQWGEGVVGAFSLMAYLRYKDLTLDDVEMLPGRKMKIRDLSVPMGRTFSMRVNYFGVPGIFPRVPFYQILKDQVDPKIFEGKIVLVGPTALEFHDSFYTPFYGMSRLETPGVEIHANAVATLLSGKFLHQAPPEALWVSLLALGVASGLLAIFLHPFAAGICAMVLTGIQLGLSIFFFLKHQTVYPTAAGIVQIWVTYLGATAYRTFIGERRERALKSTFKRYVSKDVVDEILKRKNGIHLEGDKKRITVLFSDIRGFTKMSEKMDPAVLVKELNEYFQDMIQVIFRHGGTLDKFIGDAIMAVWGSPLPHDRDAYHAVAAAWEMQQAIKKLNERRAGHNKPPLSAGIGINTGEAVVGNLGSLDRMEFTVIGDTVNTASRIEHNTLAGQVLIHEATYEEVKDFIEARAVAPIAVKGKEQALRLYEVTGLKNGGNGNGKHAA